MRLLSITTAAPRAHERAKNNGEATPPSSNTINMKDDAPTAPDTENVKPLVCILQQDGSHLDEWLNSHPPSRLGKPAAFTSGAAPQPLWVLAVDSIQKVAELTPDVATDSTFTQADQLQREAAAKVVDIQHDDDIPTRASNKTATRSKKQCRTEVQDTFHDQIMHMTADDPLWNQGRWTILARPQQIDATFAKLAHSLVSDQLRKHGSIVALRARALPFEESTYESSSNGHRRKKSGQSGARKPSSRSPSSARQAHEHPLGIDVFFRGVWSSNTAKDVLRVVAGASGRMASFCKSSLYSRLGIRSGHQLSEHTSLYNSKTLASPAEAAAWVGVHDSVLASAAMHVSEAADTMNDAGPSEKKPEPASASDIPLPSSDKPASAETGKRALESEFSAYTMAPVNSEEPAQKKARNGEGPPSEQQPALHDPAAAPNTTRQSQSQMEESQDEPMLPIHPAGKPAQAAATTSLADVPEKQLDLAAQRIMAEDAPKLPDPATVLRSPVAEILEEETQTQIEPLSPAQKPTMEAVEPVVIAEEQKSEPTLSSKEMEAESSAEQAIETKTAVQEEASSKPEITPTVKTDEAVKEGPEPAAQPTMTEPTTQDDVRMAAAPQPSTSDLSRAEAATASDVQGAPLARLDTETEKVAEPLSTVEAHERTAAAPELDGKDKANDDAKPSISAEQDVRSDTIAPKAVHEGSSEESKPQVDTTERPKPAATQEASSKEVAADESKPSSSAEKPQAEGVHLPAEHHVSSEGALGAAAAKRSDKDAPATESSESATAATDQDAESASRTTAEPEQGTESKPVSALLKPSTESGEAKHFLGARAVSATEDAGARKDGRDSDQAHSRTEVSVTHTAHSEETVTVILPAEERAQEPSSSMQHGASATAAGDVDERKSIEAPQDRPTELTFEHEKTSVESTTVAVERDATEASPKSITAEGDLITGDQSSKTTEEMSKLDGSLSTSQADANGANSETSGDKPDTQASRGGAAEMSLDDLIVEGATASPALGSQPLNDEASVK